MKCPRMVEIVEGPAALGKQTTGQEDSASSGKALRKAKISG